MRTGICLLIASLCSATVSAAPFTWVLNGQITFLNPAVLIPMGFTNPFTVGDPFSWSVTFESSAPDLAPDPTCGVYRPVTATQFTSPGVSFGGNTLQSDYSLHSSSFTGGTLDCITVPPGANIGRLRVFPIGSDLSLFMEFSGIYPTDALVVDPTNFHPIAFGVFLLGPTNTLALGNITSVTAVPEPMTALLVACGVVAALRRRQSALVLRSKPATSEDLSQLP